MAVAAIASNGKVCVWEGASWTFSTLPWCSATSFASTNLPDIVGAVYSNTPVFFVRMGGSNLGRVRRTGLNTYATTDLGRPPGNSALNSSLWVAPSIAFAGLEVGFTTAAGALWTARVTPTGGTATFTSLPALGATVSAGRTAIAGMRYWSGSGGDRLVYFAHDQNGALYRLFTNAAGAWGASWGAGVVPPDEQWRSSGVVTVRSDLLNGDTPLVFGAVGRNAIVIVGYVLHEYDGASFRDHVKFQPFPGLGQVLGLSFFEDETTGATETFTANESVVGVHSISGLATAMQRGPGADWRVTIDDATDGAFDWGTDHEVSPLALGGPSVSLTDPYVAVGADGSFHHASVQLELMSVGFDGCEQVAGSTRRLVYRRGGSAQAIANLTAEGTDLKLVETDPTLESGGMVRTSGGTRHFIYSETGIGVVTRSLSPADVFSGEMVVAALSGTPGILLGAANSVFGWAGASAPTICPLPTGACGIVGGAGGLSPPPVVADIFFGPASPTREPSTNQTCPNGGQYFRCFDSEQPVAFAAHPSIAFRVYAVWPASSGGTRSLRFTRTTDLNLNSWSAPVTVASSSTLEFIDASITVGADGTLVVTYSTIENFDATPAGEPKIAYSVNDGQNWTVVNGVTWPLWDPHNLEQNCMNEKYFLGAYREGGRVGNRVYNTLMAQAASPGSPPRVVQTGLWSSRYSIF